MQLPPKIALIIDQIGGKLPLHAKKLRKTTVFSSSEQALLAENYYVNYEAALALKKHTLSFAVDCYCKMVTDMVYYRQRFLKEAAYANRSFKEVYAAVYNNPLVMEYHIHGLALAQFLWPDQVARFEFFTKQMPLAHAHPRNFLDMGAGHGIYLRAMIAAFPEIAATVADISPSSIELCKTMTRNNAVNYIEKDILELDESVQYDVISIAEVIEHLENPLELLQKSQRLLAEDGIVFLSTPVNSPMIDHIYLFRDIGAIQQLLSDAGFSILKETYRSSEELSMEASLQLKVPIMYAAILKKSPRFFTGKKIE